MATFIKNIDDLTSEIKRLKNLEVEQTVALKARFQSPSAIFATALTLFPKSPTADGIKSAGLFKQDFIGLASRFLLPFTLNKTLFRNSNFIVKTLVGIISQKASGYINGESVGGIWGKAKSIFGNLLKKKESKEVIPAYDKYYKEGQTVNHEGTGGGYAG